MGSENERPESNAGAGARDGVPAPAVSGGRTYPKPPNILARLLLFVLKPESWAGAARYPTRVTIWTLLLAIAVVSVAVGIGQTARFMSGAHQFAANYDQNYAPMTLSADGVLGVKPSEKPMVKWSDGIRTVAVDPTNKTSLDSLKTPVVILVNDKTFSWRVGGWTMTYGIPRLEGLAEINSGTLTAFLQNNGTGLSTWISVLVMFGRMIVECLWAAFTMFVTVPIVMVAAGTGQRALLIPKRVAYRMTGAMCIPLIFLGGLLEAFGYGVPSVAGENSMLFWLVCSSAMAAWTGVMARRMYGVTPRKKAS